MDQQVETAYKPNLYTLRAELHQLLCIFHASEPIHRQIQNEPNYVKKHLMLETFENDAITKLLLSTAITLRVLNDRESGFLESACKCCGVLEKGTELKVLTLRDACNKIVHATKIEIARNALSNEINYLFPEIYLSGNYQKKEWMATVNIYEYVREGFLGLANLN